MENQLIDRLVQCLKMFEGFAEDRVVVGTMCKRVFDNKGGGVFAGGEVLPIPEFYFKDGEYNGQSGYRVYSGGGWTGTVNDAWSGSFLWWYGAWKERAWNHHAEFDYDSPYLDRMGLPWLYDVVWS